jgi:hypothetical protein
MVVVNGDVYIGTIVDGIIDGGAGRFTNTSLCKPKKYILNGKFSEEM